jgi:hypothetical protein
MKGDDYDSSDEGTQREREEREKKTLSKYYYGDEDELLYTSLEEEMDLDRDISRLDSYDVGSLQGVLDVNFEEGSVSRRNWRSDGRVSVKPPTLLYDKHFRRLQEKQESRVLPLAAALNVHDKKASVKVEASHSRLELEALLQRAYKLSIALLTSPCPLHSFAKMCVWIQRLRGLLHHSWISGDVSEEKFVEETQNLVSAMESTNPTVLEEVDAAIEEERVRSMELSEKEVHPSGSEFEGDDDRLGSLLKTDVRFLHQVCSFVDPRFIFGSVARVCKVQSAHAHTHSHSFTFIHMDLICFPI